MLHYDPLDIKRAVLFATNNALVCETPEDAMKVAYEMDKSRYDVSHSFACFMIIYYSDWNIFWHMKAESSQSLKKGLPII